MRDAWPAIALAPAACPADQPRRLTERREHELVRLLLGPFNATFVAIDSLPQRVLIAGSHLGRPHHTARAVCGAHSIGALSSSARPSTKVVRSAATRSKRSPVTNSARLKACVPISPVQPAAPLRPRSVRHAACF